MQKSYLYIVLLAMLLASCAPLENDLVKREYLPIENAESQRDSVITKAATVELFEAGESLPFNFRKLGLVKALGKGQESPDQLQKHLLYETYLQGGNAVIGVKDTTAVRYFKDEGDYTVPVLIGIAVQMEKDDYYYNLTPVDSTRAFVKNVKTQKQSIRNQREQKAFGNVMKTLFYGGILTLAIIYGDEVEE